MSRLADELDAIVGALEAGGITASAAGGQLAAPCVLVEPGDPWTEAVRMPGRLSRWRLEAIAGAADTLAGVGELAELVDLVDVALRGLEGLESSPTWAGPAVRDLGDGVRRRTTIATIKYASS